MRVVHRRGRVAGDHRVLGDPADRVVADAFFNKPSAGQLKTIFTDIAADLQRGTSALIDESVE